MILIDLNQVLISNLMQQIGSNPKVKLDEGLIRHMVLNSLRSYSKQFRSKYGEIVIACDSKKYWRRDIFPNYKAGRKKIREASGHDWASIFDCLAKIKQELKDYSPYKVIDVDTAEADDIIGTLCMEHGTILNSDEKILILSGDKDFVQLQVYGNVSQVDPVRKKDITNNDPEKFREHLVLSGDRGDGVPNVLSPDNCIIEGQRQKPLREAKIEELLRADFGSLSDDIRRNWTRNRMLIDLREIPHHIRTAILDEYNQQADKPRDKIFNYFITHKMKLLMEHIGDF